MIGGGAVGLRRAEVLRDFGAVVSVISPVFARRPAGLSFICKKYEPGDLSGAFLAISATNDPETNTAVGREAHRLGILFNRSDAPDGCDFHFPAICEGGGIVAGLVGDGSDHHKTAKTAQKIRKILEE